MPRGFILQSSYRVESGRPVVLIHGKLEEGGSFLVRDDRSIPFFHLLRDDAGRARTLGARIVDEQPPRRTLAGEPVVRVEVDRPQDCPPLRDRLESAGIECFEADVRFAYRYLVDRGIKGGCRVVGTATPGGGVSWIFDDPVVSAAQAAPAITLLSFDIETDPRAERLLAIALYGAHVDEVIVVDPDHRPIPAHAVRVASERAALDVFCRRVREIDPDVLTGWNVIDFDLAVLARIAARVRPSRSMNAFIRGRPSNSV